MCDWTKATTLPKAIKEIKVRLAMHVYFGGGIGCIKSQNTSETGNINNTGCMGDAVSQIVGGGGYHLRLAPLKGFLY